MKTYRVKYQKGDDIFVKTIYVREGIKPEYAFYMMNGYECDIIEITEVTDEA